MLGIHILFRLLIFGKWEFRKYEPISLYNTCYTVVSVLANYLFLGVWSNVIATSNIFDVDQKLSNFVIRIFLSTNA